MTPGQGLTRASVAACVGLAVGVGVGLGLAVGVGVGLAVGIGVGKDVGRVVWVGAAAVGVASATGAVVALANGSQPAATTAVSATSVNSTISRELGDLAGRGRSPSTDRLYPASAGPADEPVDYTWATPHGRGSSVTTTEGQGPATRPERHRIERYDPATIEPRWQARWVEQGLYESDLDDESRPKYYLLTMYDYPSGDLHIGHWYVKTPTDALGRYHRMKGENVFFPIGFDAFGLPAEGAAIKNGVHPATWTMQNIDHMREPAADDGNGVPVVERAGHGLARVLPLEPVVLPALPRGRSGVSGDGPGRLVPERRDAGPRAGRGTGAALLALRRARREARPRAVVLPDHEVRRRAPGLRRDRLAGADQGPADELDRPLRGRRDRLHDGAGRPSTGRRRCCASSRPDRTRCTGPRSWSSPPSIRWSRR